MPTHRPKMENLCEREDDTNVFFISCDMSSGKFNSYHVWLLSRLFWNFASRWICRLHFAMMMPKRECIALNDWHYDASGRCLKSLTLTFLRRQPLDWLQLSVNGTTSKICFWNSFLLKLFIRFPKRQRAARNFNTKLKLNSEYCWRHNMACLLEFLSLLKFEVFPAFISFPLCLSLPLCFFSTPGIK